MGTALAREAVESDDCRVVAATEAPGHPAIGQDCGALAGIGPIGVTVSADAGAMFRAADAVLDFTLPSAAAGHAAHAAEAATALVVGTTGLGTTERAALEAAAAQAVVVQAPNMSLCVNLLMRLTEQVAGLLDADYDIEIVEMHHRHKIDAPSGTALGLGRAAARGRGVALDAVGRRGRDGTTRARPRGEIGFAAGGGGLWPVRGQHPRSVVEEEGERFGEGGRVDDPDVLAALGEMRGQGRLGSGSVAVRVVMRGDDDPRGPFKRFERTGGARHRSLRRTATSASAARSASASRLPPLSTTTSARRRLAAAGA